MLKVHYHSDCPFFAGCENMLANFFNSETFRQAHLVSFSYRQSEPYAVGFRQRVRRDLAIYPVAFPDLSDFIKLPEGWPLLSKRLVMVFLRSLFTGPLLIYEIAVLFRLFRKIAPDVLHINNGGYPGALSARAAAIAGRMAGIPKTVMVVNNMADGYRRFARWQDYPMDHLVAWSVNRFITGSEAAAARLRFVLNIPAHKVIAIHNGIELRRATASVAATRERLELGNYSGVIFGVVALLIPRKGHQVLLDAVLSLVTSGRLSDKELIILIEGNGPLLRELTDFVNIHGLARWIKFVGDEENVVNFMSVLDTLILPSVQEEDFPNVILEAMALGKPVIATRLAGTPEQVVDGMTGLLVEPRNIVQLSEAICLLRDNPKMRHEMGRAALMRFNDCFTSDIVLKNYTDMYTKLTGARLCTK